MPKKQYEPNLGGDRAKVRVFFAEVEGNNESVQEALKTMVSAMSRPVRIVAEQKINGRSAALLEQPDAEEIEEVASDVEDLESAEEGLATQNERRPRGSGKKVDRNAGIELVPNLDFRPVGKLSFKEFVEQKAPTSDVESVIVALYYMQKVMSLPKVGPSHIMTAFKEISKAIPVDLKQTIRNIRKSKMWLNFSDLEDIRTTTQGDNFVEHEMGKSE